MTHIPKNILVTGAAGFIGCNYVKRELENNPHTKIISLDKLTYAGSLKNLSGLEKHRHTFIQGDICDYPLVSDILTKNNIDTIVHFAAESHVDRSIDDPLAFIQTNVIGTFTLLQAAKTVWCDKKLMSVRDCRFHHISTDEVYGSLTHDARPFTETHRYLPNSPYSASKASSDHFVRAFAQTYQLPVTLSNCSNNYGAYQHAEKLIPTVIQACIAKKPIPIYGDGSNMRDWIFVEDHCDAIQCIIRQGELNHTYNIGGDCELSNLKLTTLICDLMDQMLPCEATYTKLIQFVKDRPGHDWRYAINNQKIRSTLGWQPTTPLKIGLQKTIAFYLERLRLLTRASL